MYYLGKTISCKIFSTRLSRNFLELITLGHGWQSNRKYTKMATKMIKYKLSNYAYLQILIYNSCGGLSSLFQLVLPTKALNLVW